MRGMSDRPGNNCRPGNCRLIQLISGTLLDPITH